MRQGVPSCFKISKAFYASKIFNDTLVIVNSSVTDSSVINNLSNKPNIASSANFLLLTVINSKNTVTQGTTYSSSANVSTYFQVNSIQYKSFPLLPTSIRIDTLNNIFVSGSYSSTVVNNTNLLDLSNPVISGRFKAYF